MSQYLNINLCINIHIPLVLLLRRTLTVTGSGLHLVSQGQWGSVPFPCASAEDGGSDAGAAGGAAHKTWCCVSEGSPPGPWLGKQMGPGQDSEHTGRERC